MQIKIFCPGEKAEATVIKMKNRFDKGERKKGDRNDKQSSGSKSGAELKVKLTFWFILSAN